MIPLAGKPLIAWTIEAALAAETIGEVIVSTDDPEIAEVSRRFGARVIDRPASLATDQASSESALLHVLDELEASGQPLPDCFAFLQCTSPLTTAEHIDGTIRAFRSEGADSALAVAPSHDFLWQPNEAGNWHGINHDKAVRLRRQDLKPEYVETGAVYVMKTSKFRKRKHRFFDRTTAYIQPEICRQEIDSPDDLAIVGQLLRRRQKVPKLTLEQVAALVMDFDGVLTDDSVFVNQDGVESVRCDRGDGLGLEMLRKKGIPLFILSRENNPVVSARAKKLNIAVVQGTTRKAEILQDWAQKEGVELANTVYVGNDLNDLECLRLVGYPVAVCDAHPLVKETALWVLKRQGGRGAIRELVEMLLQPKEMPQ